MMLFKPILLLGLTTIGSSFTLPREAPNGFYRSYYNDAGEEVHELTEAGTDPLENLTSSTQPVLNIASRSERTRLQLAKRNVET
jgi:hypothetical protein